MFLDRLRVPGVRTALCCAGAGLWAASAAAQMPSVPTGPASAAVAEMTPTERAQRDANTVFKWILIHSDKPRRTGANREEKPSPAAARAKPTPRAAVAPVVAGPAVRPDAGGVAGATAAAAALPGSAPGSNANVPAPPIETALAPVAAIDTYAARGNATPAANVAAEGFNETLTPVLRVDPQFPIALLRGVRKGGVQVRFEVLPDGSVAEPAVVTSTNPRLNAAALAAVAQWRFAPVRHAQAGTVELGFDLD